MKQLDISDLQTMDFYLKSLPSRNSEFSDYNLSIIFQYSGHLCSGDFILFKNGLVKKELFDNFTGNVELTFENDKNTKEIEELKLLGLKDNTPASNELSFHLNSSSRFPKDTIYLQKNLLLAIESLNKKNELPSNVYNVQFLDNKSIPTLPVINVTEDDIKFISILTKKINPSD
ncbi:hypothetical protein [Liquorilactobacillus hordei]|uniref:hypothetical protein n=1 Tax=Liquorilactobacillus hordei TaxID=468911 RepID=UPI0039EC3E87